MRKSNLVKSILKMNDLPKPFDASDALSIAFCHFQQSTLLGKMIVFIRGNINKQINSVIIDVNGIGYLCHISNNTYGLLPNKKRILLNTYFNVNENCKNLWFFRYTKRFIYAVNRCFRYRSKTAINLLSAVSPEEFRKD